MNAVEPKLVRKEVPYIKSFLKLGSILIGNPSGQVSNHVAERERECPSKPFLYHWMCDQISTRQRGHSQDNTQTTVQNFAMVVGKTEPRIELVNKIISWLVAINHYVELF